MEGLTFTPRSVARMLVLARRRVQRSAGDSPGHEFHGNQWTKGSLLLTEPKPLDLSRPAVGIITSTGDVKVKNTNAQFNTHDQLFPEKRPAHHRFRIAGTEVHWDDKPSAEEAFKVEDFAAGHGVHITSHAVLANRLGTKSIFSPRDLGGKGSGDFGHAGRPGEVGGSTADGGSSASDDMSARVARAKLAYSPATAETQRHAEANELRIRQMVGGKRTDDNLPVDVITKVAGKVKGIEVKTLVTNTNDKITMNAEALRNKARWARQNKASVHTVVIDDRSQFTPAHYSGHGLYYRRGSGSFRLESMTRVESAAHLRRLLVGAR